MVDDDIRQQKELYMIHLEFLGFTVEEDPEDEQELAAKRDGGTLLCRIFNTGIRLSKFFIIPESRLDDRYALLEFVNETNTRLTVQVFVNFEHGSFCANMISLVPYERVAFGRFLEMFQKNLDQIAQVPNAENIFWEAPETGLRQ